MNLRILPLSAWLLVALVASAGAQNPPAPKLPIVNDSKLKIELVAGYPEVEACTTVCAAPDGSFYVGNDPRDGRLSTSQPVNTIIRFSGFGPDRKKTVFADKIYSPAGSVWHDGWLYILHDPLLTRFKDTDGDGVADVREDLVSNLGIPPNEGLNDHVVSGFTLGMDGFFYISVGDRGIFQAKSARDGSTISMQGGGIARCRTDGSQLEVYSTGTRNHLQVNLDAEDNAFTRDNTDDGNGWWTRLTHHIEGGYYGYPYDYRTAWNYGVVRPSEQTLNAIKQHGGAIELSATTSDGRKVDDLVKREDAGQLNRVETFLPAMADFGGGSPTGGLCYLSDGLPERYRGKHFFSEWGKAGIYVTEVARDGATFKLVSDTKLVEPEKGADFRPMQLSVAADGSLLIADWGYGGWKSPRTAGAIWRLSWPEAKPAPRLPGEAQASLEALFAACGHPDRDQRLRAETELVARGLKLFARGSGMEDSYFPFVQKVEAVFRAPETSPLQKMHLLWMLEQTEARHRGWNESSLLAGNLIGEAETDGDPAVRLQAVRVVSQNRVMGYLKDDIVGDPAMRLQLAICAKARQDRDLLRGALDDEDAWVRFAARTSLRAIGALDFRAELADRKTSARRQAQIWLTLAGSTHEDAMRTLYEALRTQDGQTRSRAVELLGKVAYQALPYDGHWWGTQPVKSPAAPNSIAWSATPEALAALTWSLSDSDYWVRLSAAKAFTAFTLGGNRSATSPPPSAAPTVGQIPTDVGPAELAAGAALRARLTAEEKPAIRRQLIESIGVQKDPKAVDVFRQIALDEKADPEFRETAIGAVVNIGGDPARQTITQLAAAQLSPAATRKIITAAGELKVLEAAPALIGHLKDEDAANREAAARALQQLGPKSASGPALIALLTDKDGKVQAAAVDALGSFRERAALPGIIALLEKKKALRETTGALANMPDESAIPVLVETLRDKNTTFRRNAIKALKAMREKSKPQVDALLASGRVPEELMPEIRNAFDSGAITSWKMVGVFENVWDAVHPPEKDALANNGVPNLTAKYHNAEGKDVGWVDVSADADAGRVDLEKTFKSSAMVCAYAYTEIEATEAGEAKLFTSADDEIGVWLNGQRILNQPGNHGYDPDKNETKIELRAGKNPLFVKIGNKGGTWVFHARIPGYENGKYTKPKDPLPDEKQRLFALAMKPDGSYANVGNAKNGEKLFFDQAGVLGGICATCHVVNGKGGQIGPDLSAIAANYKRPDLITSIHEPSKTIALGFEQVMVETKSGETIVGALRQETADALTITGADAQPHTVKKADVKTNTHIPTSLMPQGLTLGLKVEDFVDLIAYLESLKGK